MVFVRPRSGYQALFMGVMLLGLFLLWLRAAVLIYALFFGIGPFPGTDEIVPMLFLTPTGWAMLLVGSGDGALFAAYSFAISVFAVPMLLEEKTDALSALGIGMAMAWNNLAIMLAWAPSCWRCFSCRSRPLSSGSSLCSPCSAMQPGTPTAPCAETIRMKRARGCSFNLHDRPRWTPLRLAGQCGRLQDRDSPLRPTEAAPEAVGNHRNREVAGHRV